MAHAVSTIRVLPVPETNPPYDDEVGRSSLRERRTGSPTSGPVQGTLALSFALPSGVPARPETPTALRLGRDHPGSEAPEPDTAPPPVRRWAGRFVQALMEVLAGVRPVTQLTSWTSPDVYDRVRRRAAVPGGWPPGSSRGGRPVVHSVRVTQPVPDATEVCAVIHAAGRARAVALRLERVTGHPLCTELELG